MNAKLTLKNLQTDNSAIELTRSELRQIIGGNPQAEVQKLTQIFADPRTIMTYRYQPEINTAILHVTSPIPGINIARVVDQYGALQFVYG